MNTLYDKGIYLKHMSTPIKDSSRLDATKGKFMVWVNSLKGLGFSRNNQDHISSTWTVLF